MKKAVVFVAGVCLAFSVFAGSEITWTGEGETAAWSDGGNWEGGSAPGLGDIAVIPEGADVTACDGDYIYMNADATKLAGIRIETNAWMTVSNLSASVTHSVPLSGPGGWRHIKTNGSGNYTVKMSADNSAFTGEFFIKEGGFTVAGSKSLGTSNNKVTYYGNGGANRYFQYDVSGCSNVVHIYSNGGGYLYYGPNNKTTWGETYVHGTSQTWGSGSCVFDFNGGYFVDANVTVNCQNGVRFMKNGVVSLGAGAILSSNSKYSGAYYGITIGKPVIGTGTVRDNGSWIRFTDHANCLDRTVTLELAKASSKIQMDGGYDQQCGTLSLAAAVTEETLISAAAAAKFTVRGSASRDVKCSLNGKLSFELNSDADPENPGSAKLVSGANTMSGTLSVRRGTLTLGAESQFPNAAGLEATGDGVMVVETAAVNPGVSHLVIDSADNLQLGEALTEEKPLVVYDAKVGDYYLPVGTYDESDGYFTGAGHLKVIVKPVVEVKESVWNGSQGDGDFLNPLNWDKMPDLTHGETRLVFGGTGATAEITVPEEIHIYGITFKGEVATTISSASGVRIWLGAGGVQSEKGTASGIVNTLNAPLHFEVLPQDAWNIASGTTLSVNQPLTDVFFEGVQQVIYGGGTIQLNVDSPDLQVPLALSNLNIKVATSYALGSTNRATRLYVKGEQMRFLCETNYVPIQIKELGTITYLTAWGNSIVQVGDTICDGFTMNLNNSNYRFIGGISGSGSFYTILYGYTIDGKPMHSSSLSLYQDGSTLNLRSRDNVYKQIT